MKLLRLSFGICCLNLLLLSVVLHYSVHLGPLTLSAQDLFKPILLANGLFFLLLVTNSGELEGAQRVRDIPSVLIFVAPVLLYLPSFLIHFQYNDWTHERIAAGEQSWAGIWRTRRPWLLTGALAAANAVAAFYNVWVYRDMLDRTRWLAANVAADYRMRACNGAVELVRFPPEPNGVFFFADELRRRLEQDLAGVSVQFTETKRASCAYGWRTVDRVIEPL